jgi:hypothetical protein
MGTRSLTYIYDNNDAPIICLYGQWDGYISGHGYKLAEFLNSFDSIVNGIPVGDTRRLANGMGCLAAQLVANCKEGVGSFYLYPPVIGQDCGQEFEYHIYEDRIVAQSCSQVLFDGSWYDFKQFCEKEYEAEAA